MIMVQLTGLRRELSYFFGRLQSWGSVSVAVFVAAVMTTSLQAATPMKLLKFWNDFEENSQMQVNHSKLQSLMDEYLDDAHPSGINRFDYAGVTPGDRQKLKSYIEYLQLLDPRQLNKSEALAFWVNLYNAVTLDLILDAYAEEPIGSIRDVRSGVFTPGPWERKSVELVTKELSLEQIQNGILRPMWKDPRVHYALWFASLGAPNMPKTVLNGENNEELLNQWQGDYLKHSRALRIDGDVVVMSDLFNRFDTDFGSSGVELVDYIRAHTTEANARVIGNFSEVRYDYDWSLNSPEAELIQE